MAPNKKARVFASLRRTCDRLRRLRLREGRVVLLASNRSTAGKSCRLLVRSKGRGGVALSAITLNRSTSEKLLRSLTKVKSKHFCSIASSSIVPDVLSHRAMVTAEACVRSGPFFPDIRPCPS